MYEALGSMLYTSTFSPNKKLIQGLGMLLSDRAAAKHVQGPVFIPALKFPKLNPIGL